MKKSELRKLIKSILKEQVVAPGPVSQTMAQGGQSSGGGIKQIKPNTSPAGQTMSIENAPNEGAAYRIFQRLCCRKGWSCCKGEISIDWDNATMNGQPW